VGWICCETKSGSLILNEKIRCQATTVKKGTPTLNVHVLYLTEVDCHLFSFMRYLIFSDESGSWHKGDFYIRAWIKINVDEYNLLRKEIIFAKHETGVKELKWSKFKKNKVKFASIFMPKFKVFITVSVPKHIQIKNYTILQTIKNIPSSASTGATAVSTKIKKKILQSVKNTLFLNYFESYHIINSLEAFAKKLKQTGYQYIIDSPQFLNRDWEQIAKDCGIMNIKVEKDSSIVPGIELSDVVAGCVFDCLKGSVQAEDIYYKYIKKKMLNMFSAKLPNPNLIFFQDFDPKEKIKFNFFRN